MSSHANVILGAYIILEPSAPRIDVAEISDDSFRCIRINNQQHIFSNQADGSLIFSETVEYIENVSMSFDDNRGQLCCNVFLKKLSANPLMEHLKNTIGEIDVKFGLIVYHN